MSIIIPGFHGGQAVDPYDPLQKQTFQKAYDLDIFADQNILTPVNLPKLQAMAIPALAGQTDVIIYNSYRASDGKYYFTGTATISAATNFVLWSTTTLAASPTWTTAAAGTLAPIGRMPMEEYKDALYFLWNTRLGRWGDLSGSPSYVSVSAGLTTVGTHLLNHRGLGLLFFVHNSGHTIGRYDNAAVTLTGIVFDKSETIVGIEEYGRWVLIGLRTAGSGKSRFVLWDGSATTVDEVYNIGDSGLQAFKLVNGVIEYVSMEDNGTISKIRLSTLVPGGKPQIAHEQKITLTSGANSVNANAVSSFGDIFLYGLNGISYSDFDLGIFAHGSSSGRLEKYFALWRLVSSGIVTGLSISSIKHNGSSMIVTWGTSTLGAGTQHIDAFGTGITGAVPSTGVYESNIFPLNGGLKAKIKKITLNHKPIPASCGFTVQIKHFGDYPWGSTVVPSKTFTVTIATPGVFSRTAHGFVAGDRVRFLTTGALPTGLAVDTSYYVISAGLTANAFQVSATSGGAAIDTSGSQSGTHTIDTYVDVFGREGNSATSGLTQSTNNATFTEITDVFREATHVQMKIKFDEVSGVTAPSIIFPLIFELE